MLNKPQGVDSWLAFAKEHLVLFSTVVPLSVATIRILYASDGNPETLRALVTNIEILPLVLGTILPILPGVVFLISLEVIDWYFTKRKQDRPTIPTWVAFAWPYPVLVSIFLTPIFQLVLYASTAGVISLFRRRSGMNYGRHAVKYRTVYSGVAGLVILQALFAPSSIWLPTEKIQIREEESMSGYVLSSDVRWTSFLGMRGTVEIFPTIDVVSRTPCSNDKNFIFMSIASILTKDEYPACKSN